MKMLRQVNLIAFMVTLSVGLGAGCGKSEPPDPVAAMSPGEVALTSGLSEALQTYYYTNRNVPTNFDEFVTAAGLTKVPEPPEGKKFAIDRRQLRVVVVDR